MRSPSCLYVCVLPPPTNNFRMPEPPNMKLGMCIVYYGGRAHLNGVLINPSQQSGSVCVPPAVARQWLGSVYLYSVLGNGSVNTFPRQRIHAAEEELLDESFYMRSMSNQMRVSRSVAR
jgi:hypothetical protein